MFLNEETGTLHFKKKLNFHNSQIKKIREFKYWKLFVGMNFREWPEHYNFAGLNFFQRPKKFPNSQKFLPPKVSTSKSIRNINICNV